FDGWSGACTGTMTTCTVAMDQLRAVTATFGSINPTLTVALAGTGTGTTTASGISCPGDCSQAYPFGTMVVITAAAPLGNSFAGTGTGTVMATGINCPGDCTQDYAYGASVTLTAAAATGNTFTSWSGACTGTNATCSVAMDQARNVTATFASVNPTLNVTLGG